MNFRKTHTSVSFEQLANNSSARMRSEGYSSWVCLCLSVSVCVSVFKSHLTSQMSNRAINEHAYLVAYERQKICGDFPEMTAFKSYAAKHERKSQYANFQAYPRSAFST